MAKPIPEEHLKAIEDVLRDHPDGASLSSISDALSNQTPLRTLQYRLRHLVDQGRVLVQGDRRGARYWLSTMSHPPVKETLEKEDVSLSTEGKEIQRLVSQPLFARKPIGYDRKFLDAYRPNKTAYLQKEHRDRLHAIGAVPYASQPAGTYARKILDRLLIDLSWNSSRLEGNTYSKLDTKWLIEFGKAAEGKDRLEAQMILNHKEAIEFLVSSADEIDFNRRTILSLHALLANNLLPNPQSAGRLRSIAVGIHQSTFLPLEVPQLIEEYFDQILDTARAISDPFEQSFFVLVHMPYLQPFEDVNKRLSRLAANIPLIKMNLIPLTFSDLPRDLYTQSILGVYELNRIELLRDAYLLAYQRAADAYAAVRQILGEPDPFRFNYRDELREVVRAVVTNQNNRQAALKYVETWAATNVPESDRIQFVEVVATELLSLHEGNFARYRLRPSEFDAWQKVWERNY
jgi:Fic family protein